MHHGLRRTTLRAGIAMVVVAGTVGPLAVSGPASAATWTVCPSGCQYTQLAPAVAAAHDGDTITIGPGTYHGGVAIDVSVKLVGAGAAQTTISGGGPVLTIGTFATSTVEPTVSISGVTVTGGVTRSSVFSAAAFGKDGAYAAGGAILVPPANASFDQTAQGATVTIADSVITGNRVAPRTTVAFPDECPTCRLAVAEGGGIESWGNLTVTHSTISDNRVGSASGLSSLAAEADGGAITEYGGALRVNDSVLSGNRATGSGNYAQFAEGGGIFIKGSPSLQVTGSSITGNQTAVAASIPDSLESGANGGGIHIDDSVPTATITKTTIAHNSTSMTNTVGSATAFSGAVQADVDTGVNLTDSTVADNHVTATTLKGSIGDAGADSGAGAQGNHTTITGTLMTGNTVAGTSVAGNAFVGGGATLGGGTYIDSVISNNHATASAPNGTAYANGGGILVDTPGLTLRDSKVSGNTTHATGVSGGVGGGGIFDAQTPGPSGGPLTLIDSSITGNSITASPGLDVNGGGLYLHDWPLTNHDSIITGNTPDQCVGC